MFRLWPLIVAGAMCASSGSALAQSMAECGSLENAYGPYDYSNPKIRREKLPIVEVEHFDPGVEALRGHANHPTQLAGDLDYTLRAFPNHHRALYSMARYYLSRTDLGRPPMPRSAECYFERATRFAPKDGTVRLVHGIYLYKVGQIDGSLQRLREAADLSPNSAEVHYNIGLVYIDLDQLEKAKEHADRAYELGHPMAGLRNKLKRLGAW